MNDNRYNDNELLYLIKNNNDEDAFEKLYYKYRPLIVNRLKKFRIKSNNYEDYFQECLLTLSTCVTKYDETKGKTFNKYFDMCCVYRIRNLLRSERKYFYNVILTDYDELEKYNYIKNERDNLYNLDEIGFLTTFSRLEKDVYDLSVNGKTIKEISNDLNKSIRSIYNTFNRIRQKASSAPIIRVVSNNSPVWDDVNLSSLEKEVSKLYSLGYKPNDIAIELNLKNEQVYNALKRATKKLQKKNNS